MVHIQECNFPLRVPLLISNSNNNNNNNNNNFIYYLQLGYHSVAVVILHEIEKKRSNYVI